MSNMNVNKCVDCKNRKTCSGVDHNRDGNNGYKSVGQEDHWPTNKTATGIRGGSRPSLHSPYVDLFDPMLDEVSRVIKEELSPLEMKTMVPMEASDYTVGMYVKSKITDRSYKVCAIINGQISLLMGEYTPDLMFRKFVRLNGQPLTKEVSVWA